MIQTDTTETKEREDQDHGGKGGAFCFVKDQTVNIVGFEDQARVQYMALQL